MVKRRLVWPEDSAVKARGGASALRVLRTAIACVVSAHACLFQDQTFIRIAVSVAGYDSLVVVGFDVHQAIGSVVLETLRITAARNQRADLVAGCVVGEACGGDAISRIVRRVWPSTGIVSVTGRGIVAVRIVPV